MKTACIVSIHLQRTAAGLCISCSTVLTHYCCWGGLRLLCHVLPYMWLTRTLNSCAARAGMRADAHDIPPHLGLNLRPGCPHTVARRETEGCKRALSVAQQVDPAGGGPDLPMVRGKGKHTSLDHCHAVMVYSCFQSSGLPAKTGSRQTKGRLKSKPGVSFRCCTGRGLLRHVTTSSCSCSSRCRITPFIAPFSSAGKRSSAKTGSGQMQQKTFIQNETAFPQGSIWIGGAGSLIIGGLYWKKGNIKSAWAAMLCGSIGGFLGLFLKIR